MSVWSDIWTNIQTIAGIATGDVNQETEFAQTPEGQAVVQGAGFFGALIGFVEAATDPGMWISLGWLLLGIILIVIGVRLWMGKNAVPSPPSIVPVPL
jgi:uncharacterized membrane protein HdeD (DUF308 family)